MIRRALPAFILASLALAAPASRAQVTAPENEDGRYTFNRTDDGYLRLDARTGQVSLCIRRPIGWACQTVPDERAALEAEIARLQGENVALKKELLSRNLPLPGAVKSDPPVAKNDRSMKLPSDAELNRVMGFIEKVWRRLVEMIVNLQRDVLKKS